MSTINEAVDKIPEIYQKIYHHPEFDKKTSRFCEDRETLILSCIKEYQSKVDTNNIKVLDIGCAQGYYCFKAKELGCEVSGIDSLKENIDLCQAINEKEHSGIDFSKDSLDLKFLDKIKDGQFDVIILLSVVHHIAHLRGFDYALKVVKKLSKKCNVLITELALKEEPVFWNESLPDEYLKWVEHFSFYKELGFFPTHLSGVNRPLLFSSNKYLLCNSKMYEINDFRKKSFGEAPDFRGRSFYFSNDVFIKYIRKSLVETQYYKEILNSIKIMTEFSDLSFSPELMDFEETKDYITLVTNVQKGNLLYDLLKESSKVDRQAVILDVLENLIELEEKNLYHNDIRSWNVVVSPETNDSFLIDIGAIQKNNQDCTAKVYYNREITVYSSFITFVYDLMINHRNEKELKSGTCGVSKYYQMNKIPIEYQFFIKKILMIPENSYSYKLFKEVFIEYVVNKKNLDMSEQEEALFDHLQQSEKNLKNAHEKVVQFAHSINYLQEHAGVEDRISKTDSNIIALKIKYVFYCLMCQLSVGKKRLEFKFKRKNLKFKLSII